MAEFSDATADGDLEAVCHFVFDRAHTRWSDAGKHALTVGQTTVVAVETFVGETCNGGLIQYLGNESGAFARELPEALLRVGLVELAAIAIKMNRCFSGSIAEEAHERWTQVEEIDDALLEELTHGFFDVFEVERFRECLAGYIRRNPSEFVARGG